MAQVDLARTVRFSVNHALPAGPAPTGAGANTFAGYPPMRGLGAFYELTIHISGTPDPTTGYLLSVSHIDSIVRAQGIPIIEDAMRTRPTSDPALLLPELANAFRAELGDLLAHVEWRLTPFYAVSMSEASPGRVTITDRYEFAAAHRLHVPVLSDDENRARFGRCNNPSGHGHNYQLDVAVSIPLPKGDEPPTFSLDAMQRVVGRHVLERFDHKHLNLDTDEFAHRNPSVENLAETCFRLLDSPMERAGATLEQVTVRETEKTSCSFAREA